MSSSTSNSKKIRRRISWGLLGFLVLFGAFEIGVFRNLHFYGKEYRSEIGQFAELDVSFQHADPNQITTAVFGDSQSKDALRPNLLANASGRTPGSIFNFSISGGKAYDIYHTYLKYADRMPNLKEAIIVVNEHQINSTGMANDNMFRYYAGLKDRIRILNGDNYGELILGWVSKAFDMRQVWSGMIKSYFKGTLPKMIHWGPGGLRADTSVDPEHLTAAWANDTTDRWFNGYDLNGLQTDSFESLLRDLHNRGVKIVILQIPRSQLFEDTIKRNYPAEQQQYFDKIIALAAKYGAGFEIISNKGMPLKRFFRDVNHLKPVGAALVSRAIAQKWLK
jgi:hypothetical protein